MFTIQSILSSSSESIKSKLLLNLKPLLGVLVLHLSDNPPHHQGCTFVTYLLGAVVGQNQGCHAWCEDKVVTLLYNQSEKTMVETYVLLSVQLHHILLCQGYNLFVTP